MYGMLYRLQPGQGQEQTVLDTLFRWEQEILPTITGFVGGYIYQPLSITEIVGIFIFATKTDYDHLLDDPRHIQWFQHLLLLVEADPKCNDGEYTEFMKELRGL